MYTLKWLMESVLIDREKLPMSKSTAEKVLYAIERLERAKMLNWVKTFVILHNYKVYSKGLTREQATQFRMKYLIYKRIFFENNIRRITYPEWMIIIDENINDLFILTFFLEYVCRLYYKGLITFGTNNEFLVSNPKLELIETQQGA